MGLFSKFRKKKEKQPNIKQNEEPKLFLKEDDNKKITFKKIEGSNEVIATKEEAEEFVNIIKEKIHTNELDKIKINIMGKDFEINLLNDYIQKLDDAIIENYGTNEEIAKLNKRKQEEKLKKEKYDELKEKYEKARRMHDINSIKLYYEIIDECESFDEMSNMCYNGIIDIYIHIKHYDEAIEVANQLIDILKGLGKDYSNVEKKIKFVNELKYYRKITDLENTAESLFYATKFDESLPYFKQAIELGSNRYQIYKCISQIYLRKKDLTSAISVLNIGITRLNSEYHLYNENNNGLGDILENINNKIETGKFKWNCLPIDTKEVTSQIKNAKTILKNENKEKGIDMLEKIMSKGTFSNTVYYTLYQNYKKDNNYENCIKVCERTIDVLGYYDNDKFNKWTEYHTKILNLIVK